MKKSLFLLFWLPEMVFANPVFNENPIVHQKVQVQSWKAQRDFGIVKQDLDFSCGAASVATLLNNFYGQNVTEEEVLDKMDKTQMRASFDDMQRIMPELGFEAKGYALPFEQLVQLKIPVIVYLKYRKTDHFSVLRGINDDVVWLADPSLGHVSMSKAQFLDAWQTRDGEMAGKILAIVPAKQNIAQNGAFFVKNPTRKTQFITQQMQLKRVF
ncbi:C39 family peptidase [Wielerella bovis]|uniref:C39 family peptidase n=1 Tax=Wielerella bovis TaxID=2917790 RepID=UPI0020194DC4|nr:C39 family peptidase [Wielerella bovis]ULJ64940.1 C39 family peptidase [Wielerella bovis]ULJ67214.1 C39 family peptidase [Wielerella bovis]ULJ69486.1 C39 family peptidase [Wielerella bovis]